MNLFTVFMAVLFTLIPFMALAQSGSITWSAPGGSWDTGESVTAADMNEIKQEVDACFSSADGGTLVAGNLTLDGVITSNGTGTNDFDGPVSAPSFTADASTIPQLVLDDSDFTGEESKIVGNAIGDNNGRLSLQVEGNVSGTFVEGVAVQSTAGAVSVKIGDPAGNDVTIDAGSGQLTVTTDATGTAQVVLPAGSIDATEVTPALIERTCDWNIELPVVADDGMFQCYVPSAATLARVYCNTTDGTVTMNLYNRTELLSNNGSGSTTEMITTDLTCDTTGENTATFNSAGAIGQRLLVLNIQSTTSSPDMVRVHVEYTVD